MGQTQVDPSEYLKDCVGKLMAKLNLDGMKDFEPKWQVKSSVQLSRYLCSRAYGVG